MLDDLVKLKADMEEYRQAGRTRASALMSAVQTTRNKRSRIMSAPVYRIGKQIVRVCLDGWMYELPSPRAHNYEGRGLGPNERDIVQKAIADGSAKELSISATTYTDEEASIL